LQSEELRCDQAADGLLGLEAVRAKRYDLVLLDIDMPKMKGTAVCRHLRENPPYPHLKIIMMSGRATSDELAEIMMAGADDFLTKPLSVVQLRARVGAALRLKDAQDRSDLLHHNLLTFNADLERTLSDRDCDLIQARNALVLALAELVGCRDSETGGHLFRLQNYCRSLAQDASHSPVFAKAIDKNFINMLECCAPLHDIGKAGLPDHILLKPGKLTADERLLMQTHTTMGADTLQKVAKRHGFARAFLQMGIEITRHHHERFDGKGYPDRLAGDDIPLPARILAIADVYDALRSRRVYKPALSHDATLRMMLQESPGHFDPCLLQAFQRCTSEFERIFRENGD
jgi:putative two-component system response regulator